VETAPDTDPAYAQRIATLGRELGIPADYAARRGLALQPEAVEVVSIGPSPEGRDVQLIPGAAAAWHGLNTAAAQANIVLLPISGFRSVDRQAEIIRDKRAAGIPLDEILRLVAAPGYSEHHTGRALDLGTPDELALEESFALTAAYRWLMIHACGFGFTLTYPRGNPHGIAFEPWHWCWRSISA